MKKVILNLPYNKIHIPLFFIQEMGTDECLDNNTYSTAKKYKNISVKLLKLLLRSKKKYSSLNIQNETECYYHNRFVSKFYKWINKCVEIGTPIPLPNRTSAKLKIKVSPPINTNNLTDINQLKNLIVKNL